MKIKNIPFNITYYKDVPGSYAGLLPVRSLQMFENQGGDYHPQGLYSNIIFGRPGEERRDKQRSYIDLKVPVFHPHYFQELVALKELYSEILMGRGYAIWDDKEKDFVRADILTGETGFDFFVRHFPEITFKRNTSKQRDLRIDLLEAFRGMAFIQRLIVIPAGLRDVEITEDGQPKEEDLNPLYRRIVAVTNTINTSIAGETMSLLDGSRASMQKGVNAVYDYLFSMIEGKKGFIQGKFASRRVAGSTRNVLASMEVGGDFLGSPRQPGLNTTIVGLFQFIKACQPLVLEFALQNMYLREFFDDLNDNVRLIDRNTLQPVDVRLKDATRDKWATEDGRETLINTFADSRLRHKPVTLDGYYLKLIYQDDKYFKVMDSIAELPESFDRRNVRPMTWAEMFYLHAKDCIDKTRAFCTRYPVTGLGSIYASEVYVKTTVEGLRLKELDAGWSPTENVALEFPDTRRQLAFFDVMAVSPFMLGLLGADFDKQR